MAESMKSNEKVGCVCFVLAIPCLAFAIATWVVGIVGHIGATNYTSELRLADDASTPEKKAEYMGMFVEKVASDKELPEYMAWIVRNEQTRTANQVEVLKSLKKRCDDLGPLPKESMGYSQGMTQITGQEFEHALNSIQETFKHGYWMGHYGWFWMYAPWWSWIPVLVLICIGGSQFSKG